MFYFYCKFSSQLGTISVTWCEQTQRFVDSPSSAKKCRANALVFLYQILFLTAQIITFSTLGDSDSVNIIILNGMVVFIVLINYTLMSFRQKDALAAANAIFDYMRLMQSKLRECLYTLFIYLLVT